jgi:hypothetical protein
MRIVEVGGNLFEITYLGEGCGEDVVVELSEISAPGGFIGSMRLSVAGIVSIDLERSDLPLELLRAWLAEVVYPG